MQFEKVYRFKSTGNLYGVACDEVWYWSTYHHDWCCCDANEGNLIRAGARLIAKNVVIKCTNPN